VTIWTVATPLDFKQNVVLERFELSGNMSTLSLAHLWIYQTLQSITSPVFNEFVIWVSSGFPGTPMDSDGWRAVDTLLISLAERDPGFRVTLKGSGRWAFVKRHLPFAVSKDLFGFGSLLEDNPFRKFGLH